MKLRISLLTILIGMLFASCGLSTGTVAEQKEEGISVLRYDKLLSEHIRSTAYRISEGRRDFCSEIR